MIKVLNQPVAYPIFTFRWLAVHGLAVPTVFFLMQYINAIYSKIGDRFNDWPKSKQTTCRIKQNFTLLGFIINLRVGSLILKLLFN